MVSQERDASSSGACSLGKEEALQRLVGAEQDLLLPGDALARKYLNADREWGWPARGALARRIAPRITPRKEVRLGQATD